MRNHLWYGAVVVFLSNAFAMNAWALTCYVCSGSAANDACALNVGLNTGTSCVSCKKTELNSVITRECSSLNALVDYCETINSRTTCYCDTDYCNTTGHVTVSFATILITLLACFN
ncbi:hypothetical protein DPMN_107129 [Dreissena polymorpha]|uniref:Uncharacterized protein n=1 Tax=Dreissena polymorpha TaxID=45954 RepID=A0A9D4K673_DREPO|nr:hypothetical protein DPMN_107129 [Dreissena polymorpha]